MGGGDGELGAPVPPSRLEVRHGQSRPHRASDFLLGVHPELYAGDALFLDWLGRRGARGRRFADPRRRVARGERFFGGFLNGIDSGIGSNWICAAIWALLFVLVHHKGNHNAGRKKGAYSEPWMGAVYTAKAASHLL